MIDRRKVWMVWVVLAAVGAPRVSWASDKPAKPPFYKDKMNLLVWLDGAGTVAWEDTRGGRRHVDDDPDWAADAS